MQVHRPVLITYNKNIVLLSMHPSPIKDMPISYPIYAPCLCPCNQNTQKDIKRRKGGVLGGVWGGAPMDKAHLLKQNFYINDKPIL